MKIHRLEIIVCDPNQEDLSIEDVKFELENSRFGDYITQIVSTKTVDDGKEWYDNHPMNFRPRKAKNYFEKLVNKKTQ